MSSCGECIKVSERNKFLSFLMPTENDSFQPMSMSIKLYVGVGEIEEVQGINAIAIRRKMSVFNNKPSVDPDRLKCT